MHPLKVALAFVLDLLLVWLLRVKATIEDGTHLYVGIVVLLGGACRAGAMP